MKKVTKYLSAVAISLCMTSCADWLDDVSSTSSSDTNAVFATEETITLYVNGFYTWLSTYGQFGDRQFNGSLTEAITDIFKYSGSNLTARAGQPNQYAELAVPMSPDGNLLSCWDNAYSCIRRINQFLNLESKYATGYSEEKRIEWQAQARFFRAYLHFQLAKRHGGSIIIFDDVPQGKNKARSSAEEVWDFIAKDLDFCAENLPEAWNAANKGRVTKYAAYALKSRVMLYAERWQDAYDAADEVIKSNKFDLVPDYADAWKGNNVESILQFEYNVANPSIGPNTSFDANYSPSTDGSTASCGPAPTQELVESYEKKDGTKMDWTPWHGTTHTPPPYDQLEPRFAATVIYAGSTWKGKVMDNSIQGPNGLFFNYGDQAASLGNTCSGYFLRKLLNEDMTDVVSIKSTQTWVEIRFAEVLLNYAEAAYRLSKITDAQDALKRVRARVNLPAKTSTGDAFFADYRNERKVELAFEGQLYWDMVRWKLCATEYNNYRRHGIKIDNGSYSYVEIDRVDLQYNAKCYVLPVPTTELRNNDLIVQYDEWK